MKTARISKMMPIAGPTTRSQPTLLFFLLLLTPIATPFAESASAAATAQLSEDLRAITLKGEGFDPQESVGTESAALSVDGRYVAFVTSAPNVANSDVNDDTDVFLLDRATGITSVVSHQAGDPGSTANSSSYGATMSANGRWVAFVSTATDLVEGFIPGTTEATPNVFLYDSWNRTTTLLSARTGEPISGANGASNSARISDDGRVIVFASIATDLIAGIEDVNGGFDVFVYDRVDDMLTLASHTPESSLRTGSESSGFYLVTFDSTTTTPPQGVLSADGRYLVFVSESRDLVPTVLGDRLNAFLYDRLSNELELVDAAAFFLTSPCGGPTPRISPDGRFVGYHREVVGADGFDDPQAFVWDRQSSAREMIDGVEGGPGSEPTCVAAISNQDVAVLSGGLYLSHLASHAVTLISHGSDDPEREVSAREVSLSRDGLRIAFASTASDLIEQQMDSESSSDVFWARLDQGTPTVQLASARFDAPSTTGDRPSMRPLLSNTDTLVFTSSATDLSTNSPGRSIPALWARDLASHDVELLSRAARSSATAHRGGSRALLSADGRHVVYASASEDLVAGLDRQKSNEVGGMRDSYLHDLATNMTSLASHRVDDPLATADGDTLPWAINADGRFLLLFGSAADLVDDFEGPSGFPPCDRYTRFCALYFYDRVDRRATLLKPDFALDALFFDSAVMTPDGSHVFFTSGLDDTTGIRELFRWSRMDDTTIQVSSITNAVGATWHDSVVAPSPSADGRYVAYSHGAPIAVDGVVDDNDFFDVYLTDLSTGEADLVSRTATGDRAASGVDPMLSADGRHVVFTSFGANLIQGQIDTQLGDLDVYSYDRVTRETRLISHAANSFTRTSTGSSTLAGLSGDGRFVLFQSVAEDVVADLEQSITSTTNLYLYDQSSRSTRLISHLPDDPRMAVGSDSGHLSGDGNSVIWKNADGVYRYDRLSGRSELLLATDNPAPDGGDWTRLVGHVGDQLVIESSSSSLVPNDFNESVDVFVAGDPTCTSSEICLDHQRFAVTVDWLDYLGDRGVGHPIPLTNDTTAFWFFSEDNVEIVVKVLDGCDVFDHFWVFAAGLTDVEVEITVTDRLGGMVRRYRNDLGTEFQPILDTSAFSACSLDRPAPEPDEAASTRETVLARSVEASRSAVRASSAGSTDTCIASSTILCLSGGRFRVEATWNAPQGNSDDATAVPLSSDTGFFWFFEPDNLEVIVKVLDACDFAGSFWVFAGGLTDVGVELTVTDSLTGETRRYENSLGESFAPVRDTSAFGGCELGS